MHSSLLIHHGLRVDVYHFFSMQLAALHRDMRMAVWLSVGMHILYYGVSPLSSVMVVFTVGL